MLGVLTLGMVPSLVCKASRGIDMGQRLGSLTIVTLVRVPLHFISD